MTLCFERFVLNLIHCDFLQGIESIFQTSLVQRFFELSTLFIHHLYQDQPGLLVWALAFVVLLSFSVVLNLWSCLLVPWAVWLNPAAQWWVSRRSRLSEDSLRLVEDHLVRIP